MSCPSGYRRPAGHNGHRMMLASGGSDTDAYQDERVMIVAWITVHDVPIAHAVMMCGSG